MSGPEIVLVVAVLIGLSVQSAIGFGFALFAAPAAFAALPAADAVLLVQVLGIATHLLVLFTEGRRARIAARPVAIVVACALPGMVVGLWIVTEVSQQSLQLAVGVVVLAGVAIQWLFTGRATATAIRREPGLEALTGLGAGVLSTSVSVNGPPLVLTFSHLGLRGSLLRDSLVAGQLGIGVLASVVLLAGADGASLPGGAVLGCCAVAMLIGHRFGAAVFRRLDAAAHHRAALVAAAIAGLISIVAALLD